MIFIWTEFGGVLFRKQDSKTKKKKKLHKIQLFSYHIPSFWNQIEVQFSVKNLFKSIYVLTKKLNIDSLRGKNCNFVSKMLFSGIWKSKEELKKLRSIDRVFVPNAERRLDYQSVIYQWKRAVERFREWYCWFASNPSIYKYHSVIKVYLEKYF